ncbi:MAG: phosphotransferase [Anaerolineales bacterium]
MSDHPSPPSTLPELSKANSIRLTAPEEALIRNVHPGYGKIILEKEFGGGYSDTRVFLVLPVKTNGASDARIVTKIGPAAELRREKENYDHYIGPALPFSATQITRFYEQDGQAAVNYAFAGGTALGKTVSLEEYSLAQPAEAVNKTLDALLDKALGETWYGQHVPLHSLFSAEYGRHLPDHEDLEKIVKAIFPNLSTGDGNRIQIPGVDGSYPDPLKEYPRLLDKTLNGRRSWVHGDLHLRNVLVDESGKGWLIDFAKVTERHNLFDFIKLEVYIRLMALAQVSGAFSLNEYAQFERTLNADTPSQPSTPPANPQLAKAWQVIRAIRQIARKYMGAEPDFRGEYFPALLLYGLAMLKYYPTNGPAPTQLIFLTTCALTVAIFEEHETMEPISGKGSNPPKEKLASTKKAKAPGQGGISIGGNARDNVIVNGNNNEVNRTTIRKVNTGGGAYIGGNLNLQNGDFVGRDKVDNSIKVGDISNSSGVAIGHGAQVNLTQNSGATLDEIARVFALIREKASQEKDSAKKEDALQAVDKLKAEAERGEQAEEGRVQRWFSFLAEASADAWDVAVASLSNPALGLGTAFRKIVQRAKEEREKR